MITRLFRKSTPLNYTVIIVSVLIFFVMFHAINFEGPYTLRLLLEHLSLGILIFASLFIINFIVKKNGISKDNSYTILFFLLFLLFFPSVLKDLNLMISNFCILLSLRRMMSLHSLKSHKEKVFDASLWIFVASLFHFWSILFILLVLASILFHVARDYRNWLLPFIALFATVMAFTFLALIFDETRITYVFDEMNTNFRLDYFSQTAENVAFSIYATVALFFLVSFALTYSSKPLILHTSYKKILAAFVIGVVVFIISPNKSNDLLIFTMAPLAMMATNHIEITKSRFQNELILILVILCAVYNFVVQL